MAVELEDRRFPDADAWYEWLREHHDSSPGIWMHFAKKGSGETTVSAKDAVPPALCWGWIDGQAGSVDDSFYKVRYTPRRPRSIWSQVNVAHVERLTAAGLMQPPGIAQVEAAKADGRWDAAYSSTNFSVPPELQAALDAEPALAAAFAAQSKQNRFAMCFRIQSVKRADTKQRHVDRYVEMLRAGESLH